MAREHHVLRDRIECRDRLYTQQAGANARARIELEILSNASVEKEPAFRSLAVDEPHSISDHVEAFVVEAGGREVRPTPVAGRHVWTADAHLELTGARNQLE